jgi:hypothetical protein
MADTYDDATDDLSDSEQMASSDFRALVSGARILKGIAAAAAALAVVAAVFNFWTYRDFGAGQGGGDAQRFRQGITTALQGSWGWAMVAVVALLGSLLLRGQLARLWLDSESDGEP